MSTQVSVDAGLEPWVRFLRAYSGVTRDLNADLVDRHGLTLNEYEVLLRLARAPDRLLKRVELAQSVLLTPSGITRLLERLERLGLVERADCPTDARVSYARLTAKGLAKLREAAETHVTGIEERFLGPFSDEERATLAELLGRIGASSAPQ